MKYLPVLKQAYPHVVETATVVGIFILLYRAFDKHYQIKWTNSKVGTVEFLPTK